MPALLTSTSMRPYFAVVSAASKLRSAMTSTPPSAAKRRAISLPIPLAAPVMIATFSEKRGIPRFLSRIPQVIEHDLAQTEGQVGDVVAGRNHLAHRQSRHIAHRMLEQLDRGRTSPGAFQGHVFHVIAHQLADPRRAVDMR